VHADTQQVQRQAKDGNESVEEYQIVLNELETELYDFIFA